jgi:localization factor PodJL
MMSETSNTAPNGENDLADNTAAGRTSGDASDIKALITRLTDQFMSADERTASTLQAIQTQIATLSAQSRAARANVPDHLVGAFDRIDDAIAGLAQKVAGQVSDSHAATTMDTAEAEAVFAAFASNGAPQAEPASTNLRETVADVPVQAQYAEPAAAAPSQAGNPDQPWDRESAEALTRIYESDAPNLAPQMVAPAQVAAPASGLAQVQAQAEPMPAPQPAASASAAPMASPAAMAAVNPAAMTAAAVTLDQPWLEDRFAQIADQVAQTLTSSDAEVSFSQISKRLDDLESRFERALQDVAVKPDTDALSAIESYINEIAGQVEQSREELSRVGAIEQEIMALADRLSEERLSSMTAANQPAPAAPEIDFDSIADLVADRLAAQQPHQSAADIDFSSVADLVADRLASQSAMADSGDRVMEETGALKSLVGSMIEQQREAGDQTNAMLDTVQKALIRVLDRIDSLETAQLTIADRIDRVETPAPAARPSPAPSQPPMQAAPQPSTFEPQAPPALRAAEPQADFVPRTQPAPGAAPLAPPPTSQQPEGEPQDGKRQSFIDAARRAAQAASSRPTLSAPLAASGRSDGPPPQRTEDDFTRQAPEPMADDMPEERAVAGGSARSRLWFATFILAVLAVGAGAYIVKGPSNSDSPVARQLITPETLARERAAAESGQPAKSNTVREGSSNDESNSGTESKAPTGSTRIASATSSDSVPLGISIQQSDRELTPAELAQLEARRRQAEASSKLASALPTGAVPAALVPGATTDTAPAIGRSVGADERGSEMMPPAKIGPASLRTSAANGNASAQFEVGARFAEGRGVDQDFKQAAAWYEKSAKQGFALAQYRLATLYERGLGTGKDFNLAKYWYLKSANQGTIKAMHNLAVLTAGQGNGAKPDYQSAAAWFNRAAERGLADSQFNLAILYQNGLGVPKDMKESYKWFSLAARAGDTEAKSQEKAISAELSAADRTAVDRLVSQWRAKSYDLATNDPQKAGSLWQASTSAS